MVAPQVIGNGLGNASYKCKPMYPGGCRKSLQFTQFISNEIADIFINDVRVSFKSIIIIIIDFEMKKKKPKLG